MKRLIFPVLFVLCSCTDSTVYLRNEKTGEIAKCGSEHPLTLAEGAMQRREAQCLQDYKDQGYVRIPKPK